MSRWFVVVGSNNHLGVVYIGLCISVGVAASHSVVTSPVHGNNTVIGRCEVAVVKTEYQVWLWGVGACWQQGCANRKSNQFHRLFSFTAVAPDSAWTRASDSTGMCKLIKLTTNTWEIHPWITITVPTLHPSLQRLQCQLCINDRTSCRTGCATSCTSAYIARVYAAWDTELVALFVESEAIDAGLHKIINADNCKVLVAQRVGPGLISQLILGLSRGVRPLLKK